MHMMRTLLYSAVIQGFAYAPRAEAQVCRPADDSSAGMIQMVKNYALASDAAMRESRDSLRIPAVALPSDVALITKEVTCESANTAYQRVATGARQTLTGRVYVVRVGTSYVVWDPGYAFDASDPTDIYMVFDSHWNNKSIF
jgi:hypothetical protein